MVFVLAAIYGIGASFLNDSLAFDYCWHIRGGSTLTTILEDPETLNSIAACGPFTEALPANDYEHLVLQVLPDGTVAIPDDIAAVETFRAMEPGAQTWIYENWAIPSQIEDWTTLDPNAVSFLAWRKPYFVQVAAETNTRIIPSGDTIYGLHQAGWTDEQIFRDIGGHLNREVMSPILTELVRAVTVPQYPDHSIDGVNVAWQAVLDEPTTGIRRGDANLDRDVDISDFSALAAGFGAADPEWSQGDFDSDGDVDISDFNLLVGNFGHHDPIVLTNTPSPTPESSTLCLALSAAFLLLVAGRTCVSSVKLR
jgi:hypothetical protein